MRSCLLAGTIAMMLVSPIALTVALTEITIAHTVNQRKVEADRLLPQGIQQSQVSQFEGATQNSSLKYF